MSAKISFSPVARGILLAAAIVVVLYGLKAASDLLAPFLMAIFVTIICSPALFWLRRKGVPDYLALITVLISIGLVGAMLVGLLTNSIAELNASLPEYRSNLISLYEQFRTWVGQWGVELPEPDLLQLINPDKLVEMFNHLLSGVSGVVGDALVVFLAVLFLLVEAVHFPDKLRRVLSNPAKSMPYFEGFVNTVLHYLLLKSATSAITAGCVAVLLLVLGMDFVPLWTVLAFLLNFVPYVGSALAAVPVIIVALVDLGWVGAAWVLIGYVAINLMVGQIIETRLIGNKLDLSSFVVFVSLAFWGWILGPVGMFLSIPLTMLLLIALHSNESTQKYAELLKS